MVDFIRQTAALWEQRPFTPEQTILVGVSGGADSIALLHYIINNQLHPLEKITVVHVNHQLREQATAEAAFVWDLAQKWGVDCVVKRVDVTQTQQQKALSSLEEAAREARYQAFEAAASEYHTPFLLVGHHADDQVETVLMNLLRGSGLTGLQGMKVVTRLNTLSLFRPLLTVWRADILAYCHSEQLSYVEDESNHDQAFQRNRLRHELIPLLTHYNEKAKEHILQTADIAQADVALLEQVVAHYWLDVVLDENDRVIRLDKEKWRALAVSAQRLMLRRVVQQLHGSLRDISFEALEAVRDITIHGATSAEAMIHSVSIKVGYKDILFYLSYSHPGELYDLPLLLNTQSCRLKLNEEVSLGNDWILTAVQLDTFDVSVCQQNKNRWLSYIAVEEGAELQLRPRQSGERFQPLGMDGSMKIKDVMINEKIPAAVRDYWPIVADQSGLLWLVGYRQAQRTAVTATSQCVVQITVKEMKAKA